MTSSSPPSSSLSMAAISPALPPLPPPHDSNGLNGLSANGELRSASPTKESWTAATTTTSGPRPLRHSSSTSFPTTTSTSSSRSSSPTKERPFGESRSRKASFTSSLSSSTSSSTNTTPASPPPPPSPSFPLAPPPVKPNAHPYAIKTTSTALLSRTSSSPLHSGLGYQHWYAPPSPSPTSSTSSMSSEGSVPPSPSKRSSWNGGHFPRASEGEGRHRYSRSMNDAPPRALPVPPNMDPAFAAVSNGNGRASSVSPKKVGFMQLQPDEYDPDGRTPRQSVGDPTINANGRARRSETLPPSMPQPQFDLAFPTQQKDEDPKTWTPAQVAGYLESVLDGAEEMDEVVRIVKEKRINGRTFLRLSERVLSDEYAIDPHLTAPLLSASRTLRQATLKGRIFGTQSRPSATDYVNNPVARTRSDPPSDPEDVDIFSPHPNRGGPSGFSQITGKKLNGKVRGMIASLERSSSTSSSENGSEHELSDGGSAGSGRNSRSVSPVKGGRERERTSSTASTSRGLPARGRVGDLFGNVNIPVSRSPERLSQGQEGEVTVKGRQDYNHQHLPPLPPVHQPFSSNGQAQAHPPLPANRNKELPRLLPLPPAPPPPPPYPQHPHQHPTQPYPYHSNGTPVHGLTPAHTGVAYPLPASPDIHLRAQSTGSVGSVGSNGSGKRRDRLLPVPPGVVPSPVTVPVGPASVELGMLASTQVGATGANGNADGQDGDGVKMHHPRPRRGGPPELVARRAPLTRDEEPSMEELLSTSGNGGGGVEAWEKEGPGERETVKRIPSGPSAPPQSVLSSPPAATTTTDSVTSPKAKAPDGGEADDEDPDKTLESISPPAPDSFVIGRTGRRKRGLRPKSHLSVKGDPDANAEAEADKETKSIGAKALNELFVPPSATSPVAKRQSRDAGSQTDDEDDNSNSASSQPNGGHDLLVLKNEPPSLNQGHDQRQKELGEWEDRLSARERELAQREEDVRRREVEARIREVDVSLKEEDVERREQDVEHRDQKVKQKEAELGEQERSILEELDTTVASLERREQELDEREASLQERVKEVEGREKEGLTAVGRNDEHSHSLEQLEVRERELEAKERGLNDKAQSLAAQEQTLNDKEQSLNTKEQTLSTKEQSLSTKEQSLTTQTQTLTTKETDLAAHQRSLQTREEELRKRETTVNLAARLVRRVVGKVVGDGVAGRMFGGLGVEPNSSSTSTSSSSSSALPSPSPSSSTSSVSAPARTRPYWLPGILPDSLFPAISPARTSYFVLLGISVCAVVLRVLVKRVVVGGVVKVGGRLGATGVRR